MYSPSLGVKIPESIIETGCTDYFMDKIDIINSLYDEAIQKYQGILHDHQQQKYH